MFKELKTASLKDERELKIGIVTVPDPEWAERLCPFLTHKGGIWNWQIEHCLTDSVSPLEIRFIVGLVGEALAGGLMIAEHTGIGQLGHVFTHPDFRRQGIARRLMTAAMDDFQDREGSGLCLGTEFDSPAYHLYRSLGFESIRPHSGVMDWYADRAAMGDYFKEDEDTDVRPWQWQDWPTMNLLTLWPVGDFVRSVAMKVYGSDSVEGAFLRFFRKMESAKSATAGVVLVKPAGQVVGFALRTPETRWPSESDLIDAYAHPRFIYRLPELIDTVTVPGRTSRAWLNAKSGDRLAIFKEVGFEIEATLYGDIQVNDEPDDLIIIRR